MLKRLLESSNLFKSYIQILKHDNYNCNNKKHKVEQTSGQLGKIKAIINHLYPGVFITVGFIILAPLFMRFGFPPQFGILVAIVLVAVPLMLSHSLQIKKHENKKNF